MQIVETQNNMDRVPKCGAHSRRTGKPCTQIAMPNGRCRLHGGKSLAGIASPTYKDGMRSKFPGLPISLAEAYERGRTDPELLNLTDEIALIYARLREIVTKIDIEDAEERWKMLREKLKEFDDARARKDGYAYGQALAALHEIASEGGKDFMVWNDFLKTFAAYQKAIQQEQKRRMDMHALISTDQAVGFISEILLAVRQEVETLSIDKDEMRKVLQAIHVKVREALEKRPQFGAGIKSE
jgi:hypothetical protein